MNLIQEQHNIRIKDPIQLWKQDIQDYQKTKKECKLIPKNERFSMGNLHQKHREFHPILGIYMNPQQESDVCRKTEESQKNTCMKKMKETSKHQQNYDIVNMQSNQRLSAEFKQFSLSPNLLDKVGIIKKPIQVPDAREFNIISNREVDPEILKNISVLNHRKEKKLRPTKQVYRDYNIISNESKLNGQDDSKYKSKQPEQLNPITMSLQIDNSGKIDNTPLTERMKDFQFEDENQSKTERYSTQQYSTPTKKQQYKNKFYEDNIFRQSTLPDYEQQISQRSYLPEIQQSPRVYDLNQHDSAISKWHKSSSTYNPLFNPQRFEMSTKLSQRLFEPTNQSNTQTPSNKQEINYFSNEIGNQNQTNLIQKSYQENNNSLPKLDKYSEMKVHKSIRENKSNSFKLFNPRYDRIKTGGFLNNVEIN